MSIFPLVVILVALSLRFMTSAALPVKSFDMNTNMGWARTESFITYARATGNCALANPSVTGTLSDAWLQGQGCLPAAWRRPPNADWTNLIETFTPWPPPPGGGSLSVLHVWGTTPPGTATGLGDYLAHENALSAEAGYAPPPIPGNPNPTEGGWFTSELVGINQGGNWWSPSYGTICAGCVANFIPNGAIVMMFEY